MLRPDLYLVLYFVLCTVLGAALWGAALMLLSWLLWLLE
jgi:hypothetical protein